MKTSSIIAFAGLNGFVATAFAALGTHMLPIATSDMGLFQTAYLFHFVHALALVACGCVVHMGAERWGGRAAVFFTVGIACFCLSLYWRAIMGEGSLGNYHWITPLGGLALMGGWLTFAWSGLSLKGPRFT